MTLLIMKLLIYCWVHVITHLSKPIDSMTVRANSDVNYELWVTMIINAGPSIVTNVPLWLGMLTVGETACMGAESIWELCRFCLICCEPKTSL